MTRDLNEPAGGSANVSNSSDEGGGSGVPCDRPNAPYDRPNDPYDRPNDPYVVLPGGEDSQPPIRRLSLREHRRNFTVAATAFTLGLLIVVCSTDGSKEFLVPGPLSSHHAPLVASEGGARCATCHANANQSLASWIAGVFVTANHSATSQSELCMKCHKQSLANPFALNPHNVDPEELATLTDKLKPAVFRASAVLPSPVNHQNQIACRVCHQEHHGGQGLTELTNSQCQSCHRGAFHSFEEGHPEFVNYPQRRRSRIAFDHTSHSAKHFVDKKTEFNCNQCHIDDAFQNVKQLAPFEETCAQCHNAQILESGSQGMALVALPMLDMASIESAGLHVGQWPRAATGDFDGELPPMMRLMLSADPVANEVLNRHGPNFEFFDLDAADHNDVADAVTLVWAIKRLLHNLAADGPQAVRGRLQTALGCEISNAQLQRIITTLDGPVFQNAVMSWLPRLNEEIADNARTQSKHTRVGSNSGHPPLDDVVRQKNRFTWKPSRDDTVSMQSGGDDLLAENPLKRLMSSEEELPPTSIADTVEGDNAGKPSRKNPEGSQPPPTLTIDSNKESREDSSTTARPPAGEVDPGPAPIPRTTEMAVVPIPGTAPDNAAPQTPSYARPPSGWYRNDQTFQISYKPSGHADDCLTAWIDLVTRAADANVRPETKRLFDATISMTGIGLCRTCHTVDQLADRTFSVNWEPRYRDPSVRSFTRFAHGPHLLQPEQKDCSHCHQLDETRNNAESFASIDASDIISNFKPTTKSDCTRCHQQSRTSNDCTQCHNYHVGF